MISPFAGFTIVVVASKKLPVKSLKELIDLRQGQPRQAQLRLGRHRQLAAPGRRVFRAGRRRRSSTHVPYRNIAQYGPDLIAGTVPLGFQWYPNVAGADQAPAAPLRSRSPATSASPALPDTPTTTEAGLPEYKVDGWFALLAPARHAAADPRAAQQGADRGAQRSGGARAASRRPAPSRSRCRSTQAKKFHRRRDREVSRHHHQGRHRQDRVADVPSVCIGQRPTMSDIAERVLIAGAGPVGLVAAANLVRAACR